MHNASINISSKSGLVSYINVTDIYEEGASVAWTKTWIPIQIYSCQQMQKTPVPLIRIFLWQLYIFTVGDTGQDVFFVFFVTPWDVWNHPTCHYDDVICSDMQSVLHFELDLTFRANITDLDYVSCKTKQLLKWDFSECFFQPSGRPRPELKSSFGNPHFALSH